MVNKESMVNLKLKKFLNIVMELGKLKFLTTESVAEIIKVVLDGNKLLAGMRIKILKIIAIFI